MSNFLLTAAATGETGSVWGSYLMLGIMLVVLYVFMFLPQRKQQKKDAQMRANLDIGDEVLTQGGILGRVVSMKDEFIVIETGSDRVKLRIVRNAVIQVTSTSRDTASK